MRSCKQFDLLITGIGITSAVGQGQAEFTEALMQGKNSFGVMRRPGRQKNSSFIGAELPSLNIPDSIPKKNLRTASFSAQAALVTLHEAWEDAKLASIDPSRIGLIIGGSNFQQRELMLTYEKYSDQASFIRPTYAMSFMDSDICGLCTEQFGIKGFAYTLGGASASGQAAIIQAANAVSSGQVDVCIAVGALMDISYIECNAFRALGAMGSDKYTNEPEKACRPFDNNRDGFIYGEACGVVVIERAEHALKRQAKPYSILSGWAMAMDANRNPNPSYEGETAVIRKVLEQAKLLPQDIDYINPHGTGSAIGDITELNAIRDCGLSHAYINATKSITGHGLSAAGTVEAIATILQMKASTLHPTRNLESPMDTSFNWVQDKPIEHKMKNAISLSMGFGGINTAICLQAVKVDK